MPLARSLLENLRGVRLHLDRRQAWLTLLVLVASAAAASFAAYAVGEVAAALVFVLGITVAGALCGLASALVAALAAFLIYNFYLTEPVLTFRLATGSDVAPLIIFNLCALVSGVLAGRLKDHAEAARISNAQLNSLLALSQELQAALRSQDVVATVSAAARQMLGARIALFRVESGAPLPFYQPYDMAWQAFARDVLDSPEPLLRMGDLVGRRLDGSEGPVAVLVVEPLQSGAIEPAFLHALGNMVALALERAALSEQITERRAAARAEELKTALLASVSHDFRTPLTAISASASSLIDYGEKLDAATSARLLRGIVDECERLNRYTANLLEMSRLETANGPVSLQLLSVSEMAGAVVKRARARAGSRTIALIDHDMELLVAANPALFELVLTNILDNAIVYSDEGSRIELEIRCAGEWCSIAIADQGVGIPAHDLDRVFERFYRVQRSEASPRGSGLGLAIAKGFVEAQGGSIAATAPGIGDRGTRITISLPIAPETSL